MVWTFLCDYYKNHTTMSNGTIYECELLSLFQHRSRKRLVLLSYGNLVSNSVCSFQITMKKNSYFYASFELIHFTSIDRIPFDWRNPLGYLFAAILLSPSIFYCPIVVFCDLFLAFGVCCHLIAFTHDIKSEIEEFHDQSKIDMNKSEFIKIFRDIVELHSTTKQLS